MVKLDGKLVASEVKSRVKAEVSELTKKYGRPPGLSVVLVGDDPASKVYVKNKEKAADFVGIKGMVHRLPETASQEEVAAIVDQLNGDDTVDAILVQLPLPKHLNEEELLDRILPSKDADGLHPVSVGAAFSNRWAPLPCTPHGVIEMLKYYDVGLEGKRAVVVGRSQIVGKPMAMLLLNENATVTICHSRTKDLKQELLRAEVIVAAAGKPELITKDMVTPGTVVVDVGIHRKGDGKLCGDVAAEVGEVASMLSPVPGGVGPMTIAMLLQNTLDLFRNSNIN
jgi:methylenetetrahydrofolate dehydrogenase (NADP+)/methenyltetrahydrofolate cyclohydrolase